MAQIFKRTTVKQKIAELKVPDFNKKLAIIQQWHNAYLDRSLLNKTEGQCEQAFNDDIFKKVLGYTEYPSQPHTIIPQLSPDKGGQRADAGLGWFDGNKQRVFAVVEIKDVNKPLERSQQREGNLTPIQQAFKYKPLFKDCRFVIATNFYEIRLFQDNQLDYEQFTLKSLCDPANDYFELKKFILLLSAENFVSGRGKSRTEELLSEIRIEQEKISKDFYNEYSHLRLELMRDIWKNNKTKRDIHFVTDKAQKLLDRIVFVSFCEDSGLLPDNTLHKVFMLSDSSNNFSSVWDTLKGFFKAVDSGSEKLGIPEGYNGGLFHEDHELDSLTISDSTLKSLSSFGRYDFENELTVNILGHVFEQSISDLEEIKQKVDPDEASIKSKRKKDGIFYTPEYIVDYIVQNSLGKYLSENQERIFEKFELTKAKTEKGYRERENKALLEYQDFLHTVKVVDPACGSGAFLVKVFDYLLEENRRVGELVGGLFSQDQVYKDILRNNIYGVDLNEESVRITQLSLWLKTAQRGKKLTYLDKNIKVGNSLIDDPNIAGSKAFNWKEEFKEVFDNGGFDVVVGNPPYGATLEENDKSYLREKYAELQFKIDTYSVFILLGISILKNDGKLFYIIPNTILDNFFEEKLRKRIITEFTLNELTDLNDKIFPNAVVHSLIIGVTNTKDIDYMVDINSSKELISHSEKIPVSYFKNQEKYNFSIRLYSVRDLITKLNNNSERLERIIDIRQAIKTGNDTEYLTNEKVGSNSKPILRGRDIQKWGYIDPKIYVNYGNHLACPREESIFNQPKILIREAGKDIIAAFDENNFYIMSSLYNAIAINSNFNLKYILSLLNSKLFQFLLKIIAFDKTKGAFTKARIFHYYDLPIKKITLDKQGAFITLADEIIGLTKQINVFNKNLCDVIQSNYQKVDRRKIRKLIDLYEFDDLLDHILKSDNFNINKQFEIKTNLGEVELKITTNANTLNKVKQKLDQMVYQLYELSEDEISHIELNQ